MTEDTEKAITAIVPMANALGYKVSADDKTLYVNGQAIGIACNSTWATIIEFVGYVFIREWMHEYGYRLKAKSTEGDLRQAVRRYWINQKNKKAGGS